MRKAKDGAKESVSHHHLSLPDTQRQAEEEKRFIMENRVPSGVPCCPGETGGGFTGSGVSCVVA